MCEEQWGQKDRALTTPTPQGPVCDLGQHHDVTPALGSPVNHTDQAPAQLD